MPQDPPPPAMPGFQELQTAHPGWRFDQYVSVLRGDMTVDEVFDDRKLQEAEAELARIPLDQWPSPEIRWNENPADFHHSCDGVTRTEFAALHPDVVVMRADVEAVYDILAKAARREKDPFDEAYRSKTGKLIAHLERGGLVTPPFLWLSSAGVAFAGGNHRFAWARYTGAAEIPFVVQSDHLVRILNQLPPGIAEVYGFRGYNETFRS